jgi:opacity protein-like surface antigen
MSMPLTSRLSAAALIAFWGQRLGAEDAQPFAPVYHAWFEAGGLLSQSAELHSFPGAGGSAKLTLNPGVRVGVGSDYSFRRFFSVGWEVGLLASSMDEARGLEEIDGVINQVPFLINIAFRYENKTGFTPFVGIGLGAASTAIDIDEARSSTTTLDGSDYDFVPAWQATAGLKYEFKNHVSVGVTYKYLWTDDAEWELESDSPATPDQDLALDGIRSHALMAFIGYRF